MGRPTTAHTELSGHRSATVGLSLLVLLGIIFLIADRASDAPFFLDDLAQIRQVEQYNSLGEAFRKDCYGLFRPVKTAAFYLLHRWWPGQPGAWRPFSYALYAANIVMLYVLLRRLLASRGWALAATAIWALAPTQVSGYVWPSCINIQVMLLAILLSVLLDDELQHAPRQLPVAAALHGASVGCYLIACLCYEGAVVVPGLLLVWDYGRRRPLRTRKRVISIAVFALATLVFLLIRGAVKANAAMPSNALLPVSPLQLSFASAYIALAHLSLWLWPFGRQAMMPPLTPSGQTDLWLLFAACWLAWGVLAYATWRLRKRCRLALFALAWFGLAILPMVNLVPCFNGPFADYYLILPSIGLAVGFVALLAAGVRRATRQGRALRIAALCSVSALAGTRLVAANDAFRWAGTWNTPNVLLLGTADALPHGYEICTTTVRTCIAERRFAEAELVARHAIERHPERAQAHYLLITLYINTGELAKAMPEARYAVDHFPDEPYPWVAMAYLCENHLHDSGQAIACHRRATEKPWDASSLGSVRSLVRLLIEQGRLDEALAVLDRAVAAAPHTDAVALRELKSKLRRPAGD